VVQTYGALQESLTGVKLNLFASDEYIKAHTPTLPETRLRYDAAKKEIARKGCGDRLSGGGQRAGGSVLAHELRRGGKVVVRWSADR